MEDEMQFRTPTLIAILAVCAVVSGCANLEDSQGSLENDRHAGNGGGGGNGNNDGIDSESPVDYDGAPSGNGGDDDEDDSDDDNDNDSDDEDEDDEESDADTDADDDSDEDEDQDDEDGGNVDSVEICFSVTSGVSDVEGAIFIHGLDSAFDQTYWPLTNWSSMDQDELEDWAFVVFPDDDCATWSKEGLSSGDEFLVNGFGEVDGVERWFSGAAYPDPYVFDVEVDGDEADCAMDGNDLKCEIP